MTGRAARAGSRIGPPIGSRIGSIDRRVLLRSALALGAGVLLFLSCATFDIWPLTWLSVAPLIWLALDEKTKRPAWYGWLCGLTANGGGFYWIVPWLGRFGHIPLVGSLPIFFLLIAYQALTFLLFAWLLRRLHERVAMPITFLAPIVYCTLELVVPFVFPWYLAITQAWVRPVIQIADLTGPLGVSFLIVLVNGALYDLFMAVQQNIALQQTGAAKRALPWRRMAVVLAIVGASLGYGQVRIHQVERSRAAAPRLKVGVVQANVGINEKFRPGLEQEQLQLHQRLSAELARRGADLIVWPESSYPYLVPRFATRDFPEDDARRIQRGFHTPILLGALTAGYDAPYPFNSALILDQNGAIGGIFDKNILMVFGEYFPYYEQMKWVRKYIPEISNWSRGTDVTTFSLQLPEATVKIAPMICYEDIFPSFGRRMNRLQPNLLVNITNDAWFGRTSEPYEHLALAVFRTVENRLDLVRAVNTGVSSFVDSTGRVYNQSPSVDPGETPDAPPVALLDEVAVQTPWTLYAALGEWFGGSCLAVVLVLLGLSRARAGQPIRWRLVGLGSLALVGVVAAGVALLAGASRVPLAFAILAHRTLGPGLADDAFATGVRLLPAAALGCLGVGFLLRRLARGAAPVEAALAVLTVVVVPAVAVGTLEGEQAGLVISALAAIGLALVGSRRARAGADAQRK